jgi:hypothetical protein
MITKTTKNSHKNMSKIASNRKRGESLASSPLSEGSATTVLAIGVGVVVALEVSIGAGKINVIAGKGTSVVVGVTVGVADGVYVCNGVNDAPVGYWVFVSGVVDSVPSTVTAACTGCTVAKINVWITNVYINILILSI